MKTIITNKTIWNIAYPIILGSLAQTLITLTDTAFLGRVSEIALGASAMAGIYYYVFSTLAWGFSIGIQIIVARRLGEGKLNCLTTPAIIGPRQMTGSVSFSSMDYVSCSSYPRPFSSFNDIIVIYCLEPPSSPQTSTRQPWNTCPTAITGLYSCALTSYLELFTSAYPTQKSSATRQQRWPPSM